MIAPSGMHINLFLNGCGHHQASWRHPRADPSNAATVAHYIAQAQLAEQAAFDSVFVSDGLSLGQYMQYDMPRNFEPLTLLAAIASATSRIGLIGTMSTSFTEPFNLARMFSSLDHISNGRAGWNIVTTAEGRSAENYGKILDDHDERYSRAEEFVAVVKKLWDSWEDSASLVDVRSGVYTNPARVRDINHVGQLFKIRGPINLERSPQGYPLLVQAGASKVGREFAARHAEVIFSVHSDLASAQVSYAALKSRVKTLGRNPERVRILPGLVPVLGGTEQAARQLAQELDMLVVPEKALGALEERTGICLDFHALDEALPPLPAVEEFPGQQGRYRVIKEMAESGKTLREVLRTLSIGRGHHVVVGTPEQVAKIMYTWFEARAADGFTIMPPLIPDSLNLFVEHVVPLLRRRGLLREGYSGATVRDHYGLARPPGRIR